MASFDTTRLLGWLSVILLGTIVAIPYMSASGSRAGSGPDSQRSPLRRMASHYWLAPLLVLGSFVHAWIPMASRHVPRTNFNGLWLATFALGLMLVQLVLGVALRSARHGAPTLLRRAHFTLMLGITALVILHLWMNSPLIHGKG
jgi:hypothetical protein